MMKKSKTSTNNLLDPLSPVPNPSPSPTFGRKERERDREEHRERREDRERRRNSQNESSKDGIKISKSKQKDFSLELPPSPRALIPSPGHSPPSFPVSPTLSPNASPRLQQQSSNKSNPTSPVMRKGEELSLVKSAGGGGCPVMHGAGGPRRSSMSAIENPHVKVASKNKKKSRDDISDSRSDNSIDSNSSTHLTKLFQNDLLDDVSDDEGSSYETMDPVELKNQYRLLRKINNFTRDIAENSTQAIVVVNATTKKIFWVNGRAQYMFGKLAGDMLDQNVNILIPDEIARKHDRIVDTFMSTWSREGCPPTSKVVNPRAPRDIKAVRFLSDGTRVLFDAEIFVRYVKTRSLDKPPALFVAYLNDISENKNLKQQLKLSKVIQEKSAEAIVVCDLFGQITNCNAMTEKMFGFSLSFLLAHNKNIKWFTPRKIAEKHDSYLASFRDNLNAGYDVHKSTIIAKSRNMKGRRPGEQEDELFSIVLRVEMVNAELVAYIRDVSDSITRDEFEATIAEKVFPRCIKNKILRNQVDPYEICENLPIKTIVYTDLVNFTKFSNGSDVLEVYKFINTMYKSFDKIIPQFAGELVKRTGDGIIAMFGLEGKASKHADRAIYCCLALLQWAEENGYKMRVGVATGDVGSGVFGDGESRPAWDVLGECVNLASRMQSSGEEGRIQVTESTMNCIHDPRLRALFTSRFVDNIKGYGRMEVFLSNPVDYIEMQPLLQRRKFEIDHEKKRIMEREKRLLELGDFGQA